MNISESVLGLTLADLHSAVSEEKNTSVFGLSLGEKSIFLSTLKKQIVFVSQNMNECNKLAKELKSFGKNVKTIFFKQSEFLLGKTFGSNYENLIETLTALCTEKVDCLIITPDILLQKMPLKNSFEKFFITLKKGGTVNVKLLIHSLNNMGYKRCDIISSVGDY
ncbi:MAG: hypothetical protein IJX26_04135, partial [Clostridia bacterium]|nr:hypothetical protein [Clostridia bacterium]